jgi:hypothetical protein
MKFGAEKPPFEFTGMRTGTGNDKENPAKLIEMQKEEINSACNEINSRINESDVAQAVDKNKDYFSGLLEKTKMYPEITAGANENISDTIKKFVEKGADFGKNYDGKDYEEYVKLKEGLDSILVKIKAAELLERKNEGSEGVPEEYKEALLMSFDAGDVEKVVKYKGLETITEDSVELSFDGEKGDVAISIPGILTHEPIFVEGTWTLTVKISKNAYGKWEVDEKKWEGVPNEDEKKKVIESYGRG